MAATKISLKLLIDKKRNRVLFAEAGKDFIDFLLEVFSLPIITVAGILKTEDIAGCLQSLYESIENLSNTFIQRGVSKDLVLKPKLGMSGATDCMIACILGVKSSVAMKKGIDRCELLETTNILFGSSPIKRGKEDKSFVN